MNRLIAMVALLAGILLIGCEVTPLTKLGGDGRTPLSRWVAEDLGPYLSEKLRSHPQLKGQSFLIVDMDGDDVQADIDGLTHQIREQVVAQLLQAPGVNLVWRPAVVPWRHYHSLSDIECGRLRNTHYYIGLDIQQRAGGKAQVKVSAVDPRRVSWISGFGLSWQGRLSKAESRALTDIQSNDYLRGLRHLPFAEGQADLVAAYLARNLSCLLQNREVDTVVLYTQPISDGLSFFRTTMDLVTNYLSRFKEVRVASDPGSATYLLSGETYALGGGLYQMWINVSDRQTGRRLRGTDTDVYVRLDRFQTATADLETVVAPPLDQVRPIVPPSGTDEASEAEPGRAEPHPGNPGVQPEMVRVPGGRFEMGSEWGDDDEVPVHSVRVKGFEIGRYEVTQGQWRAVMGGDPSHFTGCDACPVESVSWDDVQSYLSKLNEQTGGGYRLPTESEWEYACRSGGRAEEYCGGDGVERRAWYWDNSGNKTHPVGGKAANGLGLYDMSGNVWEWVQDCGNASYAGAPVDSGAWLKGDCRRRVLRGGSWYSTPYEVRSSSRTRFSRVYRCNTCGFRLARGR